MLEENLVDYIEKNKKMFDDYDVHYKELEENDCIIKLQKGDLNEGHIKFIYIDGVLTIAGDYGYAVFDWHNRTNNILAYQNFKDIGYIMSKCKAFDENDVYSFNPDLAEEELKELAEEYEFDVENVPYFESKEHRDSWMYENASRLYDDAYEIGLYKVGSEMAERPFIWWTGLNVCLKYIEELKCM